MTSSKKEIRTQRAPEPVGPYSQAIQKDGFLFCSGQISIDPKTNQVLTSDVPTQAKLVMENIKALLEDAGYSFDDIVKTTIFLTKMSDFAAVNEVYSSYLRPPYPARSTVAVSELPKGVQVEIEVLAKK